MYTRLHVHDCSCFVAEENQRGEEGQETEGEASSQVNQISTMMMIQT